MTSTVSPRPTAPHRARARSQNRHCDRASAPLPIGRRGRGADGSLKDNTRSVPAGARSGRGRSALRRKP